MIHVESVGSETIEDEKQELKAFFDSGLVSKAPNLQRFLEYVCERYFAGHLDQIKEYSIAVHALNRPSDFNPQSDTIVRVTARALRKRLEQYYASEGAHHAIRIDLPPGQYAPRFTRIQPARAEEPPIEEAPKADLPPLSPPEEASREPRRFPREAWIAIAGVVLLTFVIPYVLQPGHRSTGSADSWKGQTWSVGQFSSIRFLPGEGRESLVDGAGRSWSEDRFCQEGRSFSRPDHLIAGTDDEALFTGGREGKFHCDIPVSANSDYELHLFFADTAGERVAVRQVVFYINNGPAEMLDVVDEAGGDDIATEKIYTGLHASQDGLIHLSFTADGSFVNAIELTPSPSREMLPLRMVAGPNLVRDQEGNVWVPERYFDGGRRSYHTDVPRVADAALHRWERFGHFRYVIPVVPDRSYRVTLYFSEGWFGVRNGGPGGVGSRVFDVYCNGTTLLKNFDMLKEQQSGPAIKTFTHVPATAQGKLDLSFVPVLNYPLINAVKVEPEAGP